MASDGYYAIGSLVAGLALLMLFITAIAAIPKKLHIIHWRWVSIKGVLVELLILVSGAIIIGAGYSLSLHRKATDRQHEVEELRAIAAMPLSDPCAGPLAIYKYDASINDYIRTIRQTALPYLFLEGAMLQPYQSPDEHGNMSAIGEKKEMGRKLPREVAAGSCTSLNPTVPLFFYQENDKIVAEYTLESKRSVRCHTLDELAGPFSHALLILDAINRAGQLSGDEEGAKACQLKITADLPLMSDATDVNRWKSLSRKAQAAFIDYLAQQGLARE